MNVQPRTLEDGITICCLGQYLCNECQAHYKAQGVPRAAQAKMRLTTKWVPKDGTLGTLPNAPKLAHNAPIAQKETAVPYIEQPPPDGYQLAIERGGKRPTYTSDDPLDGYAQAIAKRQKENR